ncbi:MAG: MBL fold metallo-hydrolase [Bacteroidia bacterium]|nr:MBL fold metallo-hydrolase [Bacteroidia bacterium]
MKVPRLFIITATLVLQVGTSWCQTVSIHQIDVGTGDAALINVSDGTGLITHSVLIDAGQTSKDDVVKDYVRANARNVDGYSVLDYVITSHYHVDHYGGLIGRKTPRSPCKNSYTGLLADSNDIRYFAVLDKGANAPQNSTHSTSITPPKLTKYGIYSMLAGARRLAVGIPEKHPHFTDSVIPPNLNSDYRFPLPSNYLYPVEIGIGDFISLGSDENGVPIRLRLIASNGRIYFPGYDDNTLDVAAELGIDRKNPKSKNNPNNWGIAWILEYGAFRFYTAGDIGGYNKKPLLGTCKHCREYFDLETPISTALKMVYQNPIESPGHVCTQKISHHGSCCSTNPFFWEALKPSFAVISAGPVASFGHPTQEVFDRLNSVHWDGEPPLTHSQTSMCLLTQLNFQNRNIDLEQSGTSGLSKYVATLKEVKLSDIDSIYPMANGFNLYKMKRKSSLKKTPGNVRIDVYPEEIDKISRYVVRFMGYDGKDYHKIIECHREKE